MKFIRINKYVILCLSVLFFCACSDELDLSPDDGVSTSELDQGDIVSLVNGILETMKDAFYPFYILDFDILGENFQYSTFFQSPYFNVDATNNNLYVFWSNIYKVIYNTNVLIKVASRYQGKMIDDALSSAYFLRAFSYYNLVTRFGGTLHMVVMPFD